MNEPNPLPFPAVMNAAGLEKGLATWRGTYPTYRAAMEVLTRDSANLTDIASKDDGAEVLLILAESLDGYLKWRENETDLLQSALARLILVLQAVADADETTTTTTTEEETDHGHS